MKNELELFAEDLERHYYRLSAVEQEKLKIRVFRVLFIGTLILLWGLVYAYVPLLVRLFALPVAVIGTWHLAGRCAKRQAPFKELPCDVLPSSLRTLIGKLKHAPTLAMLGAFMMVAFVCAGLFWGAN